MLPSPSPREASPSQQIKGSVLVVEDDPSSLGALSSILRLWGWDVRGVSTIADALPLLEKPFGRLILDLMLPDGDGVLILRHIRGRSLPTEVIVTTGVSDVHRLDEVRHLSPRTILTKPIDLERLRTCME